MTETSPPIRYPYALAYHAYLRMPHVTLATTLERLAEMHAPYDAFSYAATGDAVKPFTPRTVRASVKGMPMVMLHICTKVSQMTDLPPALAERCDALRTRLGLNPEKL